MPLVNGCVHAACEVRFKRDDAVPHAAVRDPTVLCEVAVSKCDVYALQGCRACCCCGDGNCWTRRAFRGR